MLNAVFPLSIAGPLWLDKMLDETFCGLMEMEVDGRGLKHEKRILKLLSVARNEAEASLTHYVIDKILELRRLG